MMVSRRSGRRYLRLFFDFFNDSTFNSKNFGRHNFYLNANFFKKILLYSPLREMSILVNEIGSRIEEATICSVYVVTLKGTVFGDNLKLTCSC